VPLAVVLPAFVASELKTALEIGIVIYLPFLIIDLIVASILMAMGMMMVSPATVSLPVKIALFVAVDGWSLVLGALAKSFGA
jgi:flagellar biosynthetic protein FliP